MSGQFLRAAFQVLDLERRPLDAGQIVGIAQGRHLLKTTGKTPGNTMRARLSDDIRVNGIRSHFQRVGPNRFGLREWNIGEYHSRPFEKDLPNETTVCIPASLPGALGIQTTGYWPIPPHFTKYLRDPTNVLFLKREEAEATVEFRQIIAYTWLESEDGKVLVYTRGKYSSAHRTLLLGRKSVGFGGHVLRQDAENLFGVGDSGIEQAAIREIGEELSGQLPKQLRAVGLILDDTSSEGQKHIGVVLRGSLPHSKELNELSSEFSINQLQLLTKDALWRLYHSMEFWSQLLMREFAKDQRPVVVSSIVPSKRPREVRCLALVGEIASGKSSISAALAEALNYKVVSASVMLRRLLGVTDVIEKDRLEFQSMALKFISSEFGPSMLADEIAASIVQGPDEKVIIDGVRQLATLAELRKRIPHLVLIYVDCPRDLALTNYQRRLAGASARRFAAVREHEVEAELPFFRFQADAIFNNADSFEATITVLADWLRGAE